MSKVVGMHPGASATKSTEMLNADTPRCMHTRLPVRKNIRADFHNYSGGLYFVTICTRDKQHYFGSIHDGKMVFSVLGKHAHEALSTLASHYSYVKVPLFVVMPNHIHAIIEINAGMRSVTSEKVSHNMQTAEASNTSRTADAPGCIPTLRTALGVVVGGYKQNVTMFARRNDIDFGWQSRFHDHIIRGNNDCNKIADYIENNVARWRNDCYNE